MIPKIEISEESFEISVNRYFSETFDTWGPIPHLTRGDPYLVRGGTSNDGRSWPD